MPCLRRGVPARCKMPGPGRSGVGRIPPLLVLYPGLYRPEGWPPRRVTQQAWDRDGFVRICRSFGGWQETLLSTGTSPPLNPFSDVSLGPLGFFVWVPVAEQYRRTRKTRRRPLLNATDDPLRRLEELFELRDPLYQEVATIVLEGRSQRVRDAVQAACKALQAERPDLCPLSG